MSYCTDRSAHSVSPRCPFCRHRYSDWQVRFEAQANNPATSECPGCGARNEACALDWRQRAACGRVLVELRNVFPGEAVPSDTLIASMNRATGLNWVYAWSDYLIDSDS